MVSINLIIGFAILIGFILAAPKIKGILGEISNGDQNQTMDEAKAVEQILDSQRNMMQGITTNGRKIGAVVGGGTDAQGVC